MDPCGVRSATSIERCAGIYITKSVLDIQQGLDLGD
jgi:hypothetical protein